MKTKSISHFAVMALLLLTLVGSTGFGPRAYLRPRHTTTTTHRSVTSSPENRSTQAAAPAPATSTRPAESTTPSLTHSLVERMARGVQAVGKALAEAVTGLVQAVADALVARAANRMMN